MLRNFTKPIRLGLTASHNSPMELSLPIRLFRFLQDEVGLPAAEIATAERLLERLKPQQPESAPNLVPIVLWQYGLLSLDQLNRVFEWLETAQ
jgi:hypothetical protein